MSRRATTWARRWTAVGSLGMTCLTAAVVGGQGVRISGSSSVRYFELLPLAQDSVAASQTTGDGFVRDSPVGPVSCPAVGDYCYYYRSRARTHTVPVTQDLEAVAWGLGTGVSAYVHVRGRESMSGDPNLYPREDDHFDALSAYVELDRGPLLARAGRQWLTSELGLTNFDGASVSYRRGGRLAVQLFGGWSLVQGLSEPATNGALAAADLLPPDKRGVLFGGAVRYRTGTGASASVEYQREIRTDRAGLYAERVAVDGTILVAATSIDGAFKADLATGAVNELAVRATRRVINRVDAGVHVRHYTPFFPLWTIWGAFSPVGYDEAGGDARWSSIGNAIGVSISGSYRRFQDTHTGLAFLPLRDDGWHVGGTATWRAASAWTASGSYDRDIGFGASRSDGSAGMRWSPNDRSAVGLFGTAFQNIYEFRVGSGTVTGLGADAGFQFRPDLRVAGDAAIYQHVGKDTPGIVNWGQRRASLRLEWTVGRDPGLTRSRQTR